MKQNILCVGLDVDDTQYHVSAFNDDSVPLPGRTASLVNLPGPFFQTNKPVRGGARARYLLWGAKTPWKRVRWTLGLGTSATAPALLYLLRPCSREQPTTDLLAIIDEQPIRYDELPFHSY